ncbi:DinB family protein [Larkinella bovis]|uniref:DinB family protein n=1 Tax=Larkinella bovis TaxID=683041 RepID=A0ABW0IEH8_9BACT
MKRIAIILFILLPTVPIWGQSPTRLWTTADQQYTVENLKRTRDELVRETATLTDAQWHFHETPERWSIAEIVEHLALWKIIWAREISIGMRNKPQPELNQTSRPDSYYKNFIMEDKPHQSPDLSKPTGFIRGKDNLTFFLQHREQAIAFAEKTTADLRAQFEFTATGDNPRNMHQVYLYQWGHVDRHLRQIRKVKAHPTYPKDAN